jgi:hypothetical protein
VRSGDSACADADAECISLSLTLTLAAWLLPRVSCEID